MERDQEASRFNADAELRRILEDWRNGLAFQESSGLSRSLPQFVRFFEGDQWAVPTERTKNLPRPVINVVKMICRNKKAGILSAPVQLVYRAADPEVRVDRLNRFARYIQKQLGQEELDKEALDHGVKKGCYIYHYFWDAGAVAQNGTAGGALRCEIIDPLNIFFAKPGERDEQKQRWILIVSREEVSTLRSSCDADVDPACIVPDEAETRYSEVEQDGSELCTVLTRYFRINGEVFCERATRGCLIQKPFPIAPDIPAARRALGLDRENPEEGVREDAGTQGPCVRKSFRSGTAAARVRAPLYPIVVGNYEIKERSIYGLGEVEGLVGVQKAVNLIWALSILNTQEYAWGKYIVHPNALQGQRITGDPGQVLVDHTRTGVGIRKMTEQTISTVPIQQVDALISLLRSVSGATEVMSGEALGANMSGSAIAQLQAQAQAPVVELRDMFWIAKRKQGLVLAQFFRLFYKDAEFVLEEEQQLHGEDGAPLLDALGRPQLHTVSVKDRFSGEDYRDAVLDVTVETVAGSRATSVGDINMLETLLAKGAISAHSFLRAYPEHAISNKTELLSIMEEQELRENTQLRSALEEAQARITQLEGQAQSDAQSVEAVLSIVRENQSVKKAYAEMTVAYNTLITEATAKIEEANRRIVSSAAAGAEARQDATDFARKLVRSGALDSADASAAPAARQEQHQKVGAPVEASEEAGEAPE